MDAALPNEIDALHQLVSTPEVTLTEAKSLTQTLQVENRLLRQKLEHFIKRHFGRSRKLELLLAGLQGLSAAAPGAQVKAPERVSTAPRAARQPLPAHLETERVMLEPEEVKQQPQGWRKLGREVTEELEWKPGKFIKRLYIRSTYAKADRILIAPLPSRLIDKGLPGAGLLTQVILSKYEYHLPLYRQKQIYRQRHGVDLSRQTLCGWGGGGG
jgi:transposase